VVPSHEEFQEASLRIRARLWLRRAQMISDESDVPDLLRGDNAEKEQRDHALCERWYERYGY